MASVIAPFTRLDMSVDYTWDWTPVDAGSTYIELRGASFFGRFTGQFNVNVTASTVTGTASTFQFARNGVNLMTFDFSPGLDAAVVATYMDNGDRLQPALAHLLRGNDTVTGQSGLNDILRGYGGNDTLDGAGGRDTAFYDGPRANYSVGLVSNNFRVTDRAGTEGTDTLLSVERIKFSDSSVALDINGTAGSAYRLYRAAFDRAPDLPGPGTGFGGRQFRGQPGVQVDIRQPGRQAVRHPALRQRAGPGARRRWLDLPHQQSGTWHATRRGADGLF